MEQSNEKVLVFFEDHNKEIWEIWNSFFYMGIFSLRLKLINLPYLGVTKLVIIVIKCDSFANLFGGNLSIDKALWNDSRC